MPIDVHHQNLLLDGLLTATDCYMREDAYSDAFGIKTEALCSMAKEGERGTRGLWRAAGDYVTLRHLPSPPATSAPLSPDRSIRTGSCRCGGHSLVRQARPVVALNIISKQTSSMIYQSSEASLTSKIAPADDCASTG